MADVILFTHALGVTDRLVSEAGGELFLYPGSAHLFTDRSWQEYDEASTKLVLERTMTFLDRVG